MSVSVQRNVRVRNYQGLPNSYRGPTGDFLCAATTTGDLTGGTVELTFVAPATIASKYVWHLTGYHLSRSASANAAFIALMQAGGESEYVSQAIVPSAGLYMDGGGTVPTNYGVRHTVLGKSTFPVTEVTNGLTLTWTMRVGENVNGVVYTASIFGEVFIRNIFRYGGPILREY